ncbi:hypothetical protein RAZWK3B_17153 [Roseobacter sp. AzwK-3b]|nr:hypothetical protein RAZWK3B_17153 [Roseobacter sp. AzwK-3b]
MILATFAINAVRDSKGSDCREAQAPKRLLSDRDA